MAVGSARGATTAGVDELTTARVGVGTGTADDGGGMSDGASADTGEADGIGVGSAPTASCPVGAFPTGGGGARRNAHQAANAATNNSRIAVGARRGFIAQRHSRRAD